MAKFGFGLVVAAIAGLNASALADAGPKVPAPHPLITEVLFAVPTGAAGDANADNSRQAIGDEFVELINPHSTPINLKGYVLMDSDAYSPSAIKPTRSPSGKPGGKSPSSKGGPGTPASGTPDPAQPPTNKAPSKDADRAQVRFTFPDLELKPGEVVVVFNGHKSTFAGPVGDGSRAPAKGNDAFHGAWVFSMNNSSPYAAFANEADFVLLVAPDGKPVECIRWGKAEKNPPSDCPLIEDAPLCIGSVQRTTVSGGLHEHRELSGDFRGSVFSPGLFKPSEVQDKKDTDAGPKTPPGKAPTSGGGKGGSGQKP